VSNQSKNNLTDQQLVDSVLRGDRHAFGLIIKRSEGLVAQIIFKMISNPGDRKDIAQDVFLKVFKNLSGFKFKSKLTTWIGQITYNTCLHYIEKKKLVLLDNFGTDDELQTDNISENLQNSSDEILFNKELAGIINSEIERLKPLYKMLICLFHQDDLSYAEIAEITSLPEGTVKSYVFRARNILKVNIQSRYKRNEL